MGIKDNFSQAVKELWKKDGQDKKGDSSGQPSELDKYLRDGDKGNAAQDGVELNNSGVPLETPYYRTPEQTAAQQAAQNAQREQAAQGAQNVSREQQGGVQAQPNAGQQSPAGGFGAQQNGAEQSAYNRNIQNIRQNFGQNAQNDTQNPAQNGYEQNAGAYNQNAGAYNQNAGAYNQNAGGGYDRGGYGGYGGGNPPVGGGYGGGTPAGGAPAPNQNEMTDEITVISKNTIIDGNVNSLANMQIDGNIKGNVQTTRNIDMSGKVIGDVTCNNAGMMSAAMQGNISLKGRMRMDRDTILIGDLSAQYADINGRVRGKLDITGKAELKRDAVVFGDINASTIAVIDGAIIQGYVNTTFLSKEDSRNVFPDAISIDSKEVKS